MNIGLTLLSVICMFSRTVVGFGNLLSIFLLHHRFGGDLLAAIARGCPFSTSYIHQLDADVPLGFVVVISRTSPCRKATFFGSLANIRLTRALIPADRLF
jgi:hypothetical protein